MVSIIFNYNPCKILKSCSTSKHDVLDILAHFSLMAVLRVLMLGWELLLWFVLKRLTRRTLWGSYGGLEEGQSSSSEKLTRLALQNIRNFLVV